MNIKPLLLSGLTLFNGPFNLSGEWVNYNSSNKEVQGWGEVYKQILRFCFTKKALTYYELKEQFRHDCLEREESLNDNLLGKIFKKDLE